MPYTVHEDSAYGVSFFERLEKDAPMRSVMKGPDPVDVLDSIKRNISDLLNTRMGEAQSAPTLGLIDFNDATLGSHDLALQIKLAILECIGRYEPRIGGMEINILTDDDSPLSLRFHITACLNSSAIDKKIQIDLLLDNNKKYRVI